MELAQAKKIIQVLADGAGPYTGDHFPADGPYNRTDTVRDCYAFLEAAESGSKPWNPVCLTNPRIGGKWTEDEDQRPRAAFHARKPFDESARDHGRTHGATTAQLVKRGIIEDTPRIVPDRATGRNRWRSRPRIPWTRTTTTSRFEADSW